MAQSPLEGIAVVEVAMDTSLFDKIEAQMKENGSNSLRCWRVYTCLNDPYWELQVMFGDSLSPWELTVTTNFWQSSMGGALASNNNPAFYDIKPEALYDSWFAIGMDDKQSKIQALEGPLRPLKKFENGNGFLENSMIGTSVIGVWIAPNAQGRPDDNNQILIAQFTSDGDISAKMNFQFRKLSPDNSIAKPTHVERVNGVPFYIDNNGKSKQYFTAPKF